MSDIPTKTYPPEFLKVIIDEAAAAQTAVEDASAIHLGDTIRKMRANICPTFHLTSNDTPVVLMYVDPNGLLHVNPNISVDECAHRMLEVLRPLIQNTIDTEVERRLAERKT